MQEQSGFTLLEVLIGVVILSFMTALMTQAGWLVTKSKRSIERREQLYHQTRIAMRQIVADLQMAFIMSPKRSAFGTNISPVKTGFVGHDNGSADTINFTTLAGRRYTANLAAADQRVVGYSTQTAKLEDSWLTSIPMPDGARNLVRRENRWLGKSLVEGGSSAVLAEGVLGFNLEYWNSKNKEWEKEWDSTGRLHLNSMPDAVRVTLTMVNPIHPDDEGIPFITVALLGLAPGPLSVE